MQKQNKWQDISHVLLDYRLCKILTVVSWYQCTDYVSIKAILTGYENPDADVMIEYRRVDCPMPQSTLFMWKDNYWAYTQHDLIHFTGQFRLFRIEPVPGLNTNLKIDQL